MQKETLFQAVEQLNQALSAISDSVSQMAISLREVSAMVECHNKSEHFPFVSSDICDSEDAKLVNSVVAASAKDIVGGRHMDELDNKLATGSNQDECSVQTAKESFEEDEEVENFRSRQQKTKAERELSSELIMKYLKNKGGRATLKQIQSRFKGYLNNTCREIESLVSRETNCIMVFNGKLSQCEVVLSETWNEGV